MARLRIHALLVGSAVAIALVAAGCSASPPTDAAPSASRTATPSDGASASPSPAPTLDVPATMTGEIARAEFSPDAGPGGTPQTAYTALGAVEEGVPFHVTGECVGGSVDFEVLRAAVGDSGTVLVSGTIECGVLNSSGYQSVPYSGPVQLVLGSTDDVQQAWLAVVAGSAG